MAKGCSFLIEAKWVLIYPYQIHISKRGISDVAAPVRFQDKCIVKIRMKGRAVHMPSHSTY